MTFAEKQIYCPNCKHDGSPECLCESCDVKRKNEFETRKVQFHEAWESHYKKIYNSLLN